MSNKKHITYLAMLYKHNCRNHRLFLTIVVICLALFKHWTCLDFQLQLWLTSDPLFSRSLVLHWLTVHHSAGCNRHLPVVALSDVHWRCGGVADWVVAASCCYFELTPGCSGFQHYCCCIFWMKENMIINFYDISFQLLVHSQNWVDSHFLKYPTSSKKL